MRLPILRPGIRGALAGLLLACVPAAAENAVMPAAASGLAPVLEADGYAAVPMTRYGNSHLAIDVRINDVPGTFILDTGAGNTVIDRARKARFDEGRDVEDSGAQATGAGGTNLAIATLPDSRLRIGDYRDDAFTAHFLALDHVNAAFSRRGLDPVDGVIGADVLERGDAVIDYPNMRLYLRNPDAGGDAAASPDQPTSEQQ